MNRFASTAIYAGTVVTATLAAALMSGNALAEGPIITTMPFVSTRDRAEVKAEVLGAQHELRATSSEWAAKQAEPVQMASGLTRAQVTAEYIASRDQVSQMYAEGNTGHFAQGFVRPTATMIAGSSAR